MVVIILILCCINFSESTSTNVAEYTTASNLAIPCTSSSVQSTSETPTSDGNNVASDATQSTASAVPLKNKPRNVPTVRKRITNASFLSQTLALQKRALQLKNRKIQLQRRMVENLESISEDITIIKTIVIAVNNVSVEKIAASES